MGIKYKSSNKGFKKIKKKFKGATPFICMGIVLVAILSLLILPDRIKNANQRNEECKTLEIGGGWHIFRTTCDRSFNKIIFVVGDTANTPHPSVDYENFIRYAYDKDSSNSGIYTISVASPSRKPKRISFESNNIDGIIEKTKEQVGDMVANRDGADYLEAISTAADSISDNDRALIYVIGSGLSDSGLLNFADDELLKIDTAKTIDETIEHIGNLGRITIFWQGLGETANPQEDLPNEVSDKLQDIYKEILEETIDEQEGKGNTVLFKPNDSRTTINQSVETNYTVKAAPFIAPKLSIHDDFNENETVIFQFIGGTNTFIDEQGTISKANEYVAKMKTAPNSRARITVYVSRGGSCSDTPDQALIQSRLDRIAGLFSEIDSSRLEFISGGIGPEQECPNGKFVESIAKNNRIVKIDIEE